MQKNILITTQRVDTEDPILHFFLDWIREFAKHYDTVYVVCLQAGAYVLPDNVVVLSLGKEEGKTRLGYIVRFYRHVIPLICTGRIQKIFAHMNEIYIFLLIPLLPIRKLLGIRIVWWKTQAKIGLFARLMRFFVDIIFTASEHGFKVKNAKKIITGHGINTKYFVPRENKRENHIVHMLVIGRAVPVKHYEDILNALGILVQHTKDFTCTVVGVRPEDRNEYVVSLEKQILDLGLSNHVFVKPPVPFSEMVEVYHSADVVINTTYPNTFDKVLLEAMACGVIAVTPTPSYESLLKPHKLFPQDRSSGELSRVLLRICEMTGEERHALGGEMRATVVEHHNVEKLIKRISEY
jgi:glycosyltransferase involved in cell wall biosynthesis